MNFFVKVNFENRENIIFTNKAELNFNLIKNENNQVEAEAFSSAADDNIISRENKTEGSINVNKIEIEIETENQEDGNKNLNKTDAAAEAQQINLTLGYRNMPHLPNGFFANHKSYTNKNKNKAALAEETSKSLQKPKADPLRDLSPLRKEKAASVAQPLKEIESEEDPLDAYMKTIEKEATLQDYQIYQEMLNQQFQQKYDEAVARDSKCEAFGAKQRIPNLSDADEDNVKVIEDNAKMEIDESKIITLEDILKINEQQSKNFENEENNNNNSSNSTTQLVLFHRGNDDLDKKFIETLKNSSVPDYDPLYGYSNTNSKQEVVLYCEDYNEYMKEDEFSGFAEEEAWLKLKKSTTEKKELKLVNHSLINYEPYRKNLYVESNELSKLTVEEVEKMRKENGDIKVRGKAIPKPIANWFQCGLSDKILKVLEKKHFGKPFPIQAQAISCIMSGRDVIGIAETGSGKTLAFVLPMLRHVLDQRPLKVIIKFFIRKIQFFVFLNCLLNFIYLFIVNYLISFFL